MSCDICFVCGLYFVLDVDHDNELKPICFECWTGLEDEEL